MVSAVLGNGGYTWEMGIGEGFKSFEAINSNKR